MSNIQFLQDLCASEEEFQVFMSASSIPKTVINVCRKNFINREFVQNIKYFIDDYTYLQQVTLYQVLVLQAIAEQKYLKSDSLLKVVVSTLEDENISWSPQLKQSYTQFLLANDIDLTYFSKVVR